MLLLVVSDLAVADVTSSMWASLYKQASICQRYASIFKVVFLFALVFYICYLLWWNEKTGFNLARLQDLVSKVLVYVAQKGECVWRKHLKLPV